MPNRRASSSSNSNVLPTVIACIALTILAFALLMLIKKRNGFRGNQEDPDIPPIEVINGNEKSDPPPTGTDSLRSFE